MNCLVLLFTCAFLAFVSCDVPPELQEKAAQVKAQCMADSGATEKMVSDAKEGNFSDDVALKKFFVCLGKAGGMLDDEGHVHPDKFKQKLLLFGHDEAQVEEVVSKCIEEKSTIEETAFEGAKCTMAILKK